MRHKRHWLALALVVICSFAILISQGVKLHQEPPPIPAQIVTTDEATLFTGESITTGQNVWQSLGGQQIGSIWGHGAYVAPDWTADWLHREATFILDTWARAEGLASFEAANPERRAALSARLAAMMRTSSFDPATDRSRAHGDLVGLADWHPPDHRVDRAGHVVGPERRVHANPADEHPALDARPGRPGVLWTALARSRS